MIEVSDLKVRRKKRREKSMSGQREGEKPDFSVSVKSVDSLFRNLVNFL